MGPIFILAIEANRNLIQFGKERQSLHPKMISTTLSKKKKIFSLAWVFALLRATAKFRRPDNLRLIYAVKF